ncbi:hypothetical protein E2320_001098 [Naja naja]|nr:hypothetical protein E2320_001098 [Naja naja]
MKSKKKKSGIHTIEIFHVLALWETCVFKSAILKFIFIVSPPLEVLRKSTLIKASFRVFAREGEVIKEENQKRTFSPQYYFINFSKLQSWCLSHKRHFIITKTCSECQPFFLLFFLFFFNTGAAKLIEVQGYYNIEQRYYALLVCLNSESKIALDNNATWAALSLCYNRAILGNE